MICGCVMPTTPSMASLKEIASSVRVSFPLSILDMSSTSLMSPSKCRLDSEILRKQFCTCLRSSICAVAMAVMPTIAFIGVRISWLILARNSLLALLASSAAWRAFPSSCSCWRVRKKYRRKISVRKSRMEPQASKVMKVRCALRSLILSSNMP